ncbi:MAG: LutB/LldF family L-lactate oxidation iron-sulfur protein [Planctomycetota bacterium]|jgi:L-lactate dehydrogenase complex protein LldF
MSGGTHLPMEAFPANARDALRDVELSRALNNMAETIGHRRRAAVAHVGPETWEALRTHARAIKDATLAQLDVYLEEFVRQAEARGTKIHWARDADEACGIIADLAASCGAQTVVKSKSMTSEEIRLGDRLEAGGMRSVETDLGEWIVQIAGEVPSHIIVPAIHKTKEGIARLFHDKVGTDADADAETLTAAAREILRDAFAEAELGISGVNFAVAETGTFLILENEGNARLTTSLPRVHIALMGIEKVIPRFEDLGVFLQLLPRSGTGQHLTTYQTLITGPKTSADGEGPEEVHIVLLDNGRSRFLAREVTRQSLACIRCGACLNVCPVYQSVGGHAYGSVYPGPIGAVITPQLAGVGKAEHLPFASSLCGACREVCPVRIDIPALLLDLRAQVVEDGKDPGHGPVQVPGALPPKPRRGERLAFAMWAFVVAGPRRFAWAARLGRIGQRLIARGGRIGRVGGILGRIAPPLAAWTAGRDARTLAPRSFREQFARRVQK